MYGRRLVFLIIQFLVGTHNAHMMKGTNISLMNNALALLVRSSRIWIANKSATAYGSGKCLCIFSTPCFVCG